LQSCLDDDRENVHRSRDHLVCASVLGTHWARAQAQAGWAQVRGMARIDWARAGTARHGRTGHGLGTGTGGLGMDWARARADWARTGHGRVGHGQIVSERHEYPIIL
jgi:hypothetical protein